MSSVHVQMGKLPLVLKYVVIIAFCAYVAYLCTQTYSYYEEYQKDIWFGIEATVEAITLPFKIAQLTSLPKEITLLIPVYDVELKEIADTWGEARSQGRSHEGTDIFASKGTPVYSATNGYVIKVGNNNLGGTIVFTMGPGGVRYYYAHLDSIASGIHMGSPVTTDTVLGFVGDSGNALGTPPHLHFGVYDNAPQNPYPMLADR